jgi:hypothetical protein
MLRGRWFALAEKLSSIKGVLDLEEFVTKERYILPHSLTELAEMYFEDNLQDDSQTLLLRARQYSGYDFDKPLHR